MLSGYDLYRIARRLGLPPRLTADAFCKQEFAPQTLLPAVVLRPNAWMQVGLSRIAADLSSGDVLRSQHLGAGVSYLDARDIADVAVEALLNPEAAQQRLVWALRGLRRPQGEPL